MGETQAIGKYSIMSQEVVRRLTAAGSGPREFGVMSALLSGMPNAEGEVGLGEGGIPMSSGDIAEYSGIRSATGVRQALQLLVAAGVIEPSRKARRGRATCTVYKLASELAQSYRVND